jgi:hypothetical protein
MCSWRFSQSTLSYCCNKLKLYFQCSSFVECYSFAALLELESLPSQVSQKHLSNGPCKLMCMLCTYCANRFCVCVMVLHVFWFLHIVLRSSLRNIVTWHVLCSPTYHRWRRARHAVFYLLYQFVPVPIDVHCFCKHAHAVNRRVRKSHILLYGNYASDDLFVLWWYALPLRSRTTIGFNRCSWYQMSCTTLADFCKAWWQLSVTKIHFMWK